jgi:hypothetical protein
MKQSLYHFITIRRAFAGFIIAGVATCGAFADVVTDWNATLEAALRNPTPSMPAQARTSAIVHVAIFDAVNGITKKYTPLRVIDSAPPGARPEAAAAYAAYTTLVSLFPTKQAMFDAQLAASLAQIPGGNSGSTSIAVGRAWGEMVAQQILAWRANDGYSQPMTYPGNTNVGYWRHAPLGDAPAAGLSMSVTEPFALKYLENFDFGPPYGAEDRVAALTTANYAREFDEVKARGGIVSTVRTPAQTDLALFINVVDVADINAVVRRLLPASSRLEDKARTFALLNIAASDAAVVCFKAKYKYGFWRPLQAIPYADLDGNPATSADPTWKPRGLTPSHPENMSEQTAISGAMLAVAAALLGDATPFTLTTSNTGAPAIAPAFPSFFALADTITDACIDLGIHFRSACGLGQFIGEAIAYAIVQGAMLPQSGGGVTTLAVRGRVAAGDDTLVAGFNIIASPRQTLIRAVGPALGSLGVGAALADPQVAVFDSAGRIVAENDNWSAGSAAVTAALAAASAKAGAFPLPLGSRDAAVITTLLPGSYTIRASGAAGASGVTLLELFEVP